MSMKVAICEDEATQREQLVSYLNQLSEETGQEYAISQFRNADELLEGLDDDTDLLLLDILMGEKTGVDAAKKIRESNSRICIIFITSAVQYALEGYGVRAFGFIAKPINYSRFRYEIGEALRACARKNGKMIILVNGKNKEIVNSNSIISVEVYGHHLNVTLPGERRQYTMPMSEAVAMLDMPNFFRCHKSFLINFNFVKRFLPGAVEMTNGDHVPVSKHRAKEMMDAFTVYLGNQTH